MAQRTLKIDSAHASPRHWEVYIMTDRVEQNIFVCTDVETGDFDWDEYQYLCDIADYWDCDE